MMEIFNNFEYVTSAPDFDKNNREHSSELTAYKKFASIMDIVFKNTGITMVNSINVFELNYECTKSEISNNKGILDPKESSFVTPVRYVYDRKVDLLTAAFYSDKKV
ncbi:hypothetical protein BDF21DRAFT_458729 [Thamnidium elegans]|nr:hypothetical protein BDF21DRAFT_458729 [Thamnidium elegans]